LRQTLLKIQSMSKITNAKKKKQIYSNRRLYREHSEGIVFFARNVMHCIPEAQQEEALILFQKIGRVCLKAGHGVGKTVFLIILMFHHLFCYTGSSVVCTAPTEHQLKDVLWTEAARWINRSVFLKDFLEWTATKIAVKTNNDLLKTIWNAKWVTSRNPDNLAGRHEKRLLFLVDEAPGVQEKAFPVIEGALTQEFNRIAMIGNPVRASGFFHSIFKNPVDWGIQTLSCLKSSLVSPDYAARIANRFGKESNIYRVRVLGEFPEGEDDQVLSISLIQDAMWREEPLEESNIIAGGCDVAMTGKNRTVIYIRKGYRIIDELKLDYAELNDNVEACLRMIFKHHPIYFNIDKTGVGAGVFTEVRRRVKAQKIDCEVIGIDFGGEPLEKEIYRNTGTEMYWNLREVLKKAIIPNDDNLLGGLTIRKYTYREGKLWVPGKKELMEMIKKENKEIESFSHLDEADALALCFYMTKNVLVKVPLKVFYRTAMKV
jgi:phage terminase large subunit